LGCDPRKIHKQLMSEKNQLHGAPLHDPRVEEYEKSRLDNFNPSGPVQTESSYTAMRDLVIEFEQHLLRDICLAKQLDDEKVLREILWHTVPATKIGEDEPWLSYLRGKLKLCQDALATHEPQETTE